MAKTKTEKDGKPEASVATATEEPKFTPNETKEIRVIERVIEDRQIQAPEVFKKLSRPQIELIKRTVAKGASDEELNLFLQVCKGANLNPFMKQVHLVPRWDSVLGREVRAIQVGIDGLRAIAEEGGAYAGNDDPKFEGELEIEVPRGKEKKMEKMMVPSQATVTVYKVVQGQRYAFSATARWPEYYPGPRNGFQWHIRPYLMLGKCAEALALRKAFPKLLSGMYAPEEMEHGRETDTTQKNAAQNFETLKKALEGASLAELEDYRAKMDASDKYTAKQKKEFSALVDARIAELTQSPE